MPCRVGVGAHDDPFYVGAIHVAHYEPAHGQSRVPVPTKTNLMIVGANLCVRPFSVIKIPLFYYHDHTDYNGG